MVDLQFSGVFDRQETAVPWDVHAKAVQGRRLTRTGAAGDDEVGRTCVQSLDPNPHHGRQAKVHRSEVDQVDHRQRIFLEFPDGQRWPVRRDRRDGPVDTGAVGEAAVEDGHHARAVAEGDVRERGDVGGDLEAIVVVNPDVGSAHAVVTVRDLHALRPSVVHHFFKRVVLKQGGKVAVGIRLDGPLDMVDGRRVVGFVVDGHATVLRQNVRHASTSNHQQCPGKQGHGRHRPEWNPPHHGPHAPKHPTADGHRNGARGAEEDREHGRDVVDLVACTRWRKQADEDREQAWEADADEQHDGHDQAGEVFLTLVDQVVEALVIVRQIIEHGLKRRILLHRGLDELNDALNLRRTGARGKGSQRRIKTRDVAL